MGRIKINISIDCHGWLYADPVSSRVDRQIRARLKELGHKTYPGESLLFIQNDSDQEAFSADFPASARRRLSAGWPVVVLCDSWLFEQMCGCDW